MAEKMTTIRLTTSLASPARSWRAGDKYECSEREAAIRLQRGEAVPYVEGEPDYIPPDGVDAHVIVNKVVREQTTAVQPSGKSRQRVGA